MNPECSNPFLNSCGINPCCRHRNCCYNNITPITGPQGPAGTAATIATGTTITGAPGTSAMVTNSGTSSNAVLNFVIPRGEAGAIGPQGPAGENGQAATVTVGTTTTLPAGSQATVTNSGSASNAILNFGIPQGGIQEAPVSGSFISRNSQTFTTNNSTIELPITLNTNEISITNNSVITIPKSSRYMINYGIKSTTIGNTFGIYVNGINNQNTNLETSISDLNPYSSIILQLNANDTLTLGAVNASASQQLTLQTNTINAYLTIISLD